MPSMTKRETMTLGITFAAAFAMALVACAQLTQGEINNGNGTLGNGNGNGDIAFSRKHVIPMTFLCASAQEGDHTMRDWEFTLENRIGDEKNTIMSERYRAPCTAT